MIDTPLNHTTTCVMCYVTWHYCGVWCSVYISSAWSSWDLCDGSRVCTEHRVAYHRWSKRWFHVVQHICRQPSQSSSTGIPQYDSSLFLLRIYILYTNRCIGNGFLHFPWPIYWMQGLQANVVNTVFLAYMLCKCRRPLGLKLPFPLSVFVHIWLWTSFMDGLLLFLHITYEKFV